MTSAAAATASSVHVAPTRAKIWLVHRSVQSGADLFIDGILTSGKHACVADQVLKLLFKGKRIASKRTNNNGRAFFKVNPRRTGKWQIRFAGLRAGDLQHAYSCTPSQSNRVTVTVS